mmetsp:Transcript_16897/g.22023  ORF Transcript_16897/g.22023 Transcript_16897/m.22023 type:complete len:91 (+) Transcript_16897:772-1044(+)
MHSKSLNQGMQISEEYEEFQCLVKQCCRRNQGITQVQESFYQQAGYSIVSTWGRALEKLALREDAGSSPLYFALLGVAPILLGSAANEAK